MTIDPLLKARLELLVRRQRRLQLGVRLAACWAVAAVVAFGLHALRWGIGWSSALALPVLALAGVAAAIVLLMRHRRTEPDWRELARQVEVNYPDLKGLLLTAVQQQPAADGELSYLQDRLLNQAIEHSRQNDWAAAIPRPRVAIAQLANFAMLALFLVGLSGLRDQWSGARKSNPFAEAWTRSGVTVSPGDTSLERGDSLVVMTRFEGRLPASVDLVITSSAEPDRRIPLVKSLADPMFGGSVLEVATDLLYHVEYAGERTRDFRVKVFEYPRLERADADLAYPEYTGLSPKRLENTRRLSAVEGSRLDLTLQLNKPVVSARLVAKDNATNTIPLTIESNRPVVLLKQLPLAASKTWQLQLVDADGRTNKVPAQFVIDVLKNRAPEIKLALPRGDIRPSALEEVSFEGTVWDDFGVQAYGLAFTLAGKETKYVELGHMVPGKEKRPFQYALRLEDLAVQPDQLISYFVWADDIGPDGQPRRSTGDLFFAEVRPFEEVFRESQSMAGEQSDQDNQQQQQSGEQSQQGNRPGKLADLQKQIISATWRLQREQGISTKPKSGDAAKPARDNHSPPSASTPGKPSAASSAPRVRFMPDQFFGQRASGGRGGNGPRGGGGRGNSPLSQLDTKPLSPEQYQEDAGVVRDSQAQALDQAQTAQESQEDPRTAALWAAATKEMEKALDQLKASASSPAALAEALAAEQAAYQALLKLQQRQYDVTRSRNQRGQRGQSSRQQQMQRQLDQLDLTQEQNRYETQRQARAPQNQSRERQEQLQVQNRLAELARRQQDVNDRLKELQASLQEARTEQERQDLQRQLKRLQEEEQQMIADADELQQRMDRQENQSRMAEQRQQLEQARQDMQRAADAAQQGAASQALASGTRAQRQMQQIRDDLRRQNSSEFAEDLRQMRGDARELARQQEDVQKKLEALDDPRSRTLSDGEVRKQLLDQLDRQKQRLTNLVDRAAELSQQTEATEPLVSHELYDTVRKFNQEDADNVKQVREELLNRGLLTYSLNDRLKQTTEREQSGKSLDLTSDLVQQDYLPQARQAETRARTGIGNLKRGVESAAERVLGDDAEALRLAQQQLDQLTDQIQREIAEGQGGQGTNAQARANGNAGRPGQNEQAQGDGQPGRAGQRGQRGAGELAQNGSGQTPDGTQPGQQARNGGRGQGRGEQAQADEQPGSDEQAQAQGEGRGQRGQRGQQARAGGRGQGARGGRDGSAQDTQQLANAQDGEPQPEDGSQPNGGRQGGRQGGRGNAANRGGDLAQAGRNGGPRNANNAGRGRRGTFNNEGGYGGNVPFAIDDLLDGGADRVGVDRGGWLGPVITGDNYANWSDQLRSVEEMVDEPFLQNQMATARERARVMRQEYRRDLKKPDWTVVQLQVLKPLVEVRDRIAEELARREPKDNLVPIDRDPVPTRYSELVRRYYEELGKEK